MAHCSNKKHRGWSDRNRYKGLIKIMNPLAEALTGWKFEEASGKTLPAIFNITGGKNKPPVNDPVEKVIREGCFYGLSDQTILISKDNIEIPIDIIGTPILDEKNEIMGVVLVFYDIIERKLLEEKLKKA